MEPVISDIRDGYDRVASAYALQFIDEQMSKPMDREMLQRFSKEVANQGVVCDMGCGPGQIAGYLYDHCGIHSLVGIDLSQEFIREAKKLHPQIPFYQGNMLSLKENDNSWAGITAFYCLIHIPHEQIVDALKELMRVLIPGGVLLLTYHIGNEIIHVDTFFEKAVSMDFILFEPMEMENYLREAGFERIQTTVREPYAPEVEHQTKRGYVFAYKPKKE